MKLLTAAEARGLNKADDDKTSQVIALINQRIKLRSAAGYSVASLGYTEETEAWNELPPVDQQSIIQALETAGYIVLAGEERAIRISWTPNLEKLDD